MVFILSALWWIRIRGLWRLPDGRDWLWRKLGLVLVGEAMLGKSLIQFSTDGWGCVASLYFGLKPHYCRGNGGNGNLLQKNLYRTPKTFVVSAPDLAAGHWGPRDSGTLTSKSDSVSCGVTAPFSWLLVCTRFCLCPPRVCIPSPVEVL